ncbi:MAG TPA: hypothetical protein PKE69_15875 [Pyrinomonadaceae bacterium]|nr:hypothetical protein [Pyrinomonadaceae bacterium]
MDLKDIEKELQAVRQLADYVSGDLEATKRLHEIKEKTEIALKAINQIEGFQ